MNKLEYYEQIKKEIVKRYPMDAKIQNFMFTFYRDVPIHFQPLSYEDITTQYPGIDSWWYIENNLNKK